MFIYPHSVLVFYDPVLKNTKIETSRLGDSVCLLPQERGLEEAPINSFKLSGGTIYDR
jgi:hypothetical protein